MEDNNKDHDSRRELLLLKQDQSGHQDSVFREAKAKYAKQRTKLDDFLYYAKWILIIGGIAALLLVFLIIQTVSRDDEDIRIALVSYDRHIEEYGETLKSLLGNYTPDYDNNGEISVVLRTIDLTERDMLSQYSMSESEKLTTEMRRGVVQAVISDEAFYEFANSGINENNENGGNVFVDMSTQFPEFALYKGCGIRLKYTLTPGGELAGQLPEDLILYIRAELPDFNNSQKAAQYRNEALTVVKNIAEKMDAV